MNMEFRSRKPDARPFIAPTIEPSRLAFAASLLRHRELRKGAFSELEFVDAEWFIMLELYVASGSGKQLSLSDLYYVAGIPKSTAIRAIDELVKSEHLCRDYDPKDARRKLVWLEPAVFARLDVLLSEMQATTPTGCGFLSSRAAIPA